MTTTQSKVAERCIGSSQPPARRHPGDDHFGWCADCEHWRRLIVPNDERRVRLRSHWAPAA